MPREETLPMREEAPRIPVVHEEELGVSRSNIRERYLLFVAVQRPSAHLPQAWCAWYD